MKNSFIIPYEYEEQLAELTDAEIGQLVRAMFQYEKNLIKPNFTDRLLKTIWVIVEKNLDYLREKYDKRCDTSAENGKRGGRPKKAAKSAENSDKNGENTKIEKPKKPNQNLTEPKKADNDNDNDINILPSGSNAHVCACEDFAPPTLKEISDYCTDKKLNVSPDKFLQYYEATKWHDRNGRKITSWQAQLVTWSNFEPQCASHKIMAEIPNVRTVTKKSADELRKEFNSVSAEDI